MTEVSYRWPEVVGGGEQDEAKECEQHVVERRAALIVLKVSLGHSLEVTGRSSQTEDSSTGEVRSPVYFPLMFRPWGLCKESK